MRRTPRNGSGRCLRLSELLKEKKNNYFEQQIKRELKRIHISGCRQKMGSPCIRCVFICNWIKTFFSLFYFCHLYLLGPGESSKRTLKILVCLCHNKTTRLRSTPRSTLHSSPRSKFAPESSGRLGFSTSSARPRAVSRPQSFLQVFDLI